MAVNPLGFLQDTTHLYVKQKKEWLEIFTGFETNNKYEISNDAGQVIMYAMEDTDCCSRMCCAGRRPFTINILSLYGPPLMTIVANLDCCGQNVEIEIPSGRPFAHIRKEFACCTPSFFISNVATGEQVFRVDSSCAAWFGSFGTVDFDIKGSDGVSNVGRISKKWGGFLTEWFTDADIFGVSMPRDMAVEWKAVILAILFHIDMTFYEDKNRELQAGPVLGAGGGFGFG